MRILLAVDGSECSNAAVEEVGRRPWPDGTQVRVVSAVEPIPLTAMPETWGPPTDFYERMEKASREQAEGSVQRARGRLRELGLKAPVSGDVVDGFPKEAILKEAESWGADLIVVGSHGYRGFRRLWLGSVSHAVAAHADCSVEIVRARAPKS